VLSGLIEMKEQDKLRMITERSRCTDALKKLKWSFGVKIHRLIGNSLIIVRSGV